VILYRFPNALRTLSIAFLLLAARCPAHAAQDSAPSPDAMAAKPDARDFISRSETNLMSLGNLLRFAGFNASWLGLRSDTGLPQDSRLPTSYEVDDALGTVQAMGGGYIRAVSLIASAGCALCLAPAPGEINPQTLAVVDHLLRKARDDGLKFVLPLAGSGACPDNGPADPVAGTQCVFARARGLPGRAFYTDPRVRNDFVRHVLSLLNQLNPETGIAWKDDATILAWENCDGCGDGIDNATLADWTEFVGQALKADDKHHLYENGAFAGRLGPGAGAPTAAQIGLPSVDIVGDRLAPKAGSAPNFFVPAQQAVTQAGRIYFVDSYGWAPSNWTTLDDLEAFFTEIERDRLVNGVFASDLGAHADQGGWLPPTRPGMQMLYFPQAPTPQVDTATMAQRSRAVRRLSYGMMDLSPVAFALPDQPEILSAQHGKLTWRGTPGASAYSVQRSSDITQRGSWVTLCDLCVTDADPHWQDPSMPAGPIWYRLMPYNPNMHFGMPSEPVKDE
jgi:mannan endo-1,4-beta-mannosidase